MRIPRITAATAIDDHTLLVRFDNEKQKKYDVAPLFDHELFAPLRNTALFKAVRVEQGGYAVVWNDDIDISEHELWINGITLP